MKDDRWLEAFEARQRRIYEEQREKQIAEALRDGIRTLTLPLPGGGEERIDLRLH
jgi:hypothetical protein